MTVLWIVGAVVLVYIMVEVSLWFIFGTWSGMPGE